MLLYLCILLFIAFVVVSVLLIMSNLNDNKSFKNEFITDINNSFFKNMISRNLIGRIYDSNNNHINCLYQMSNFRKDLNKVLDSADCIKKAFSPGFNGIKSKWIEDCLGKNVSLQNKNGILSLLSLIFVSAEKLMPGKSMPVN